MHTYQFLVLVLREAFRSSSPSTLEDGAIVFCRINRDTGQLIEHVLPAVVCDAAANRHPNGFQDYAQRDETRREHLGECRSTLGYIRLVPGLPNLGRARIAFNESIGTDRGEASMATTSGHPNRLSRGFGRCAPTRSRHRWMRRSGELILLRNEAVGVVGGFVVLGLLAFC
jgi:hypothetical protein